MLCFMHDDFYRNFCLNRGTCLVKIRKTEFEQFGTNQKLFAKVMRSRAFCSCPQGFTGTKCETGASQLGNAHALNNNIGLGALIEATRGYSRAPVTNNRLHVRSNELNYAGDLQFDGIELKNAKNAKVSGNCDSFCNKTCSFGFKMDYSKKCLKCECLDVVLSECGVPCYMPNTEKCLTSQRANSRPICVCNADFGGSLCEKCKYF